MAAASGTQLLAGALVSTASGYVATTASDTFEGRGNMIVISTLLHFANGTSPTLTTYLDYSVTGGMYWIAWSSSARSTSGHAIITVTPSWMPPLLRVRVVLTGSTDNSALVDVWAAFSQQ